MAKPPKNVAAFATDLFDYFGELFNTHHPKEKYTQATASVVYDVLDDYIVHASINNLKQVNTSI